jgi:hypothetical protein
MVLEMTTNRTGGKRSGGNAGPDAAGRGLDGQSVDPTSREKARSAPIPTGETWLSLIAPSGSTRTIPASAPVGSVEVSGAGRSDSPGGRDLCRCTTTALRPPLLLPARRRRFSLVIPRESARQGFRHRTSEFAQGHECGCESPHDCFCSLACASRGDCNADISIARMGADRLSGARSASPKSSRVLDAHRTLVQRKARRPACTEATRSRDAAYVTQRLPMPRVRDLLTESDE